MVKTTVLMITKYVHV